MRQRRKKKDDFKSWFTPGMLRMFLTTYIIDRTPRQRCVQAVDLSAVWVDEYLETYKEEVAAAVAGFTPENVELDELHQALPGFLAFAKDKDPELLDRPAGMYLDPPPGGY
jgi:hypothetical protein